MGCAPLDVLVRLEFDEFEGVGADRALAHLRGAMVG
jgi:hypothetical protein